MEIISLINLLSMPTAKKVLNVHAIMKGVVPNLYVIRRVIDKFDIYTRDFILINKK